MLDETQKNRLLELYAEGAELPAAERSSFVERSCAGDQELRNELAELLSVSDSSLEGFLDEPFVAAAATDHGELAAFARPRSPSCAAEPVPRIGGYEQLVWIAEGGMGTVYRARQVHPVQRTVAIKAIRPGMDSRSVLARFEAERQALARMSHPHIAAVYDAGTDAEGRPFLAMEFVDGRPITVVCREEGLDLDARLRLFLQACAAVDHAHRRGVLHRDLKPSNVLVSRDGARWTAKVIDFGIAKAMEEPFGDFTLLTEQGGIVGTPEYMSPEQFEAPGRSAGVDTRVDVYALGVMLYELIADSLPLESARLRGAGMFGMGEIVRLEVPPKPSTRVRQRTSERPAPRGDRFRPVPWAQRLPGDLDWIAMKALEKDPERRYGSPHELAEDLERYLEHRPVLAGPPSGLYRIRKFTRRYRVQVGAAAAVLLSLVLGLFGTIHYLLESRTNEAAANRRAAQALAAQRTAEGIRIASNAALLAAESPNVALLLAVEASERTDDSAVHRTIHRVLPNHRLVGAIDAFDHPVREIRFLGDGRLVAQPFDTVTLVCDPDSGAILQRLTGHTDVVLGIAAHAEQPLLLTGSQDGTVRLWDLDRGDCRWIVDGPGGAVTAVAFAPGAARFVALAGGRIGIYDLLDGALRDTLDVGGSRGAFLSIDPEGRRLVAGHAAGGIRVWRLGSAELEWEVSRERLRMTEGFELRTARWAPDGASLVACTISELGERRLWGWSADGRPRFDVSGWSTDGFLDAERVLAFRDDAWGVLSAQDGALIEGHEVDGLRGLRGVAPDGSWALGTDPQRDFAVVGLTDAGPVPVGEMQKLRGESDKQSRHIHLSFHPDGERFALSGSRVRIWSIDAGYAPHDLPGVPEQFTVASIALGARSLALLERRHTDPPAWELHDLDERRRHAVIRPEGIRQLWLSPDATRLVGTSWATRSAPSGSDSRVVTLDLEGRILHETSMAPSRACHVRPDGVMALLAFDTPEGGTTGEVVDLASGAVLSSHRGYAVSAHWSGGPRFHSLIYLFGSRSRTEVLDVATGEPVASLRGPDGLAHYGTAVSIDRRFLAVVFGNRTARVYDLSRRGPSGAPRLLSEYFDLVRSNTYECGFLAGGRLTWAMCSNEVHVFESATGRPFTVLALENDCVAVVERPDGSEFLTVTRSGRVQRWTLDPVAVAKQRAVGALTRRQLDQFDIGTADERHEREVENLRSVPTVRNLARLGELALESGDLDGAIASYRAALALAPLAPQDRHRYVRLLELLCRGLARADLDPARRAADLDAAWEALREAVRCGADAAQLEVVPGIEVLRGSGRFAEIVPR